MQMSDREKFLKRINMEQVIDSDKCWTQESLTASQQKTVDSIAGNSISNLSGDKSSDCNHFIHEPEELSALYDSRFNFQTISPIFYDKMALESTKFITDKVLNIKMNDEDSAISKNEEDSLFERKQSLQSLNELELGLIKNKYCTDADVLNAVSSVFSECQSPVNNGASPAAGKVVPQANFLEKVAAAITQSESYSDSNSVNSVDIWSDEDDRYPPQMSLSPLPGETTFRKMTFTAKEAKSYEDTFAKYSVKSDDGPGTYVKRSLMRTLSPITSKHTPDQSNSQMHNSVPGEGYFQNLTTSFLINSTENVAKSVTSPQWKPRPPYDWVISSPSLIRPIISTPPRTRKHKPTNTTTEIFALSYGNKMKEDKLFDGQRSSIPAKRKVSRSQSNNITTSSKKLFPSIAQTQAASKSISDFRQSSSLFGKIIKKNIHKETPNIRNKNTDLLRKTKDSDDSENKVGETTRRKLRRILSLH